MTSQTRFVLLSCGYATCAVVLALMVQSRGGSLEATPGQSIMAGQGHQDTSPPLGQDQAPDEAWQRHVKASREWEQRLAAWQAAQDEREQAEHLRVVIIQEEARREQARQEEARRREEARRDEEARRREEALRELAERASSGRVWQGGSYSVPRSQLPRYAGGGSDTLSNMHRILENASPNTRAYERREGVWSTPVYPNPPSPAPSLNPSQSFGNQWLHAQEAQRRAQEHDRNRMLNAPWSSGQ
jgi:hypothetical protein